MILRGLRVVDFDLFFFPSLLSLSLTYSMLYMVRPYAILGEVPCCTRQGSLLYMSRLYAVHGEGHMLYIYISMPHAVYVKAPCCMSKLYAAHGETQCCICRGPKLYMSRPHAAHVETPTSTCTLSCCHSLGPLQV